MQVFEHFFQKLKSHIMHKKTRYVNFPWKMLDKNSLSLSTDYVMTRLFEKKNLKNNHKKKLFGKFFQKGD